MNRPKTRWSRAACARVAAVLFACALSAASSASAAKLGEPCGARGGSSVKCDPGLTCASHGEAGDPRGGVCVDAARSCGGLLGTGCAEGEYCDFAEAALCGAADQTGTCKPRPAACTLEHRPVCGCDDQTYANACAAHAAGVSVAASGECGECRADEDCPHGACDHGVTCQGEGCPPPPPSACTACGDGSMLRCKRALQSCPEGQVREIVNGCYGACVDRHTCEAPASSCEYDGQTYEVGETFPASDGCNTCSCAASGRALCTLKLCTCDYTNDPTRSWVAKDPEKCKVVRFNCVAPSRYFANGCGCGCEGIEVPPPKPSPKCQVGGCSGQLCGPAGEGRISTCEWRDEYACYRGATCAPQPNGRCGWTPTAALKACLGGAR